MFNTAKLPKRDRTWVGKVCVHLFSSLLCIFAIGCIGFIFQTTVNVRRYWVDGPKDFNNNIWAVIPLVISLLWSVTYIAYLLYRKRPVQQGYNVIINLLIAVGLIIAAIHLSNSAVNDYRDFDINFDYFDDDDYTDIKADQPPMTVQAKLKLVGRVEVAASLLLCLASVAQAVLFFWACFDSNSAKIRSERAPAKLKDAGSDDASYMELPLFYTSSEYKPSSVMPEAVPCSASSSELRKGSNFSPVLKSPFPFSWPNAPSSHHDQHPAYRSARDEVKKPEFRYELGNTRAESRYELDDTRKPKLGRLSVEPGSSFERDRTEKEMAVGGGQSQDGKSLDDIDSPISPI